MQKEKKNRNITILWKRVHRKFQGYYIQNHDKIVNLFPQKVKYFTQKNNNVSQSKIWVLLHKMLTKHT